jgi:primary-amine oxidase
LELKLTGILNTYALNDGESTHGWGTRVHPGVNAHNHQHLFCLRIDPQIDGNNNSIVQSDAMPSDAPVGSPENKYGNAFYAKSTVYKTPKESISDYNSDTSRSWGIVNPNKYSPVLICDLQVGNTLRLGHPWDTN